MTPIARTLATLSVLSVLGVLAGCGQGDSGDAGADSGSDSASDSASDTASDPAAGQDDGAVCPDTLPGSGTATPADASPELPQVESAWVCEYTPTDGGDSGAGSADGPTWQLDGDEVQVPADELPALTESLAGLTPADGDRFCTEEIGPRWLLVTADAEGDTTGVVVDGFGCRDVRLTDDPAATVPGAARQSGDLVGGVLTGPEGLADRLADLHG